MVQIDDRRQEQRDRGEIEQGQTDGERIEIKERQRRDRDIEQGQMDGDRWREIKERQRRDMVEIDEWRKKER